MPISQIVRAAVSGMLGQRLQLDVIANNLANVNTTGYKASRLTFQDAVYEASRTATTNRDLRLGAGVVPASIEPAFTQGALQQTDRLTDLAIYGDGFFGVRLPDGTLAYTRNGSFRLDQDGRLVTSDGLPLAQDIIVPPGTEDSLTVDPEGIVRINQIDPLTSVERSVELGQIQLYRFNNPEGLTAIGQTLFQESASSGAAEAGLPNSPGVGQIVQRAQEVSNVNIVDEMTNLLMAQRAYGLSVKALQTIDEMLGLANNIRAQ
jgi:flagellar basal-body rod protein FlgG